MGDVVCSLLPHDGLGIEVCDLKGPHVYSTCTGRYRIYGTAAVVAAEAVIRRQSLVRY